MSFQALAAAEVPAVPPPVPVDDLDDLALVEARLVPLWLGLLSELPQTREHAAFLERTGQSIHIVDGVDDGTVLSLGGFNGGRIAVNVVLLAAAQAQLEIGGLPAERMARVLAVKSLPIVVHEIRHAMTLEALRAETGLEPGLPTLEDELLSFMDAARTARAAARRWPKDAVPAHVLDDPDLDAAAAAGPAALRAYVRRRYKGIDDLSLLGGETLALRAREREAEVGRLSPHDRLYPRRGELAALCRRSAALYSDPAKAGRLREWYLSRVAAAFAAGR